MEEFIKQDLLKKQKEQEDYLLKIKNEKTKQEEIKQKQIEEDIIKKELAIKTSSDDEIKRHIDTTVNSFRIKMTSELENEKKKLINECENKLQTLRCELQTEKDLYYETKRSYYKYNCSKCKNPFTNEYNYGYGSCYISTKCKVEHKICVWGKWYDHS